MKKYLISLMMICLIFLSSCYYDMPNFDDAKSKMSDKGYEVIEKIMDAEQLEELNISQERSLSFEKDGKVVLEVFYFKSESDKDAFYSNYANTLKSDSEILKVNKYSIYKGTKSAINDFLH